MRRIRCLMLGGAVAAAALSLTACKKDGVVAKDESVESVAKKVAESNIKPQPGRWESSVKLDKMEMPGMPEQAKAALNQRLGAAQTFASCLTAEQVNQPGGNFFQQGAKDCKYDHFTMADGRIDAVMTCQGPAGKPVNTEMKGTYNAQSYDITVNSKTEMQPNMPMTVAMTIASRRTGECNGSEQR